MKIIYKFVLLIAIMAASNHSLKAELGFEFLGGLSTPSEKVGDVYNSNLKLDDINKQYIFESAKLGYHIGARLRMPLGDNFMFTGAMMWNRFPMTDIQILIPNNSGTGSDTINLSTSQNIIPLSAGMNIYLFRNVIGVYATGDLSYNIIQNTVDYNLDGISIPVNLELSTKPTNTRVGASFGAGVDFDLGLLTLNLEGKYHYANLIGKVENEPDKNYFTLTMGIVFGATK